MATHVRAYISHTELCTWYGQFLHVEVPLVYKGFISKTSKAVDFIVKRIISKIKFLEVGPVFIGLLVMKDKKYLFSAQEVHLSFNQNDSVEIFQLFESFYEVMWLTFRSDKFLTSSKQKIWNGFCQSCILRSSLY